MASALAGLRDRVRGSLFVVPMVFVIAGVLLAEVMLRLDGRSLDVPDRLTATVDSARAVLTVVSSATLAFAGVAFSVALLLISQAASQYSPRVVHGLFRDPFTRRVMGVVIGTFTYCLVVLRAVRAPLDGAGEAVIPSMSILLAVVLGVVAILSTVGFISHAAHSLDVSHVLHRVTAEALDALPAPATGPAGRAATPALPQGPAQVVSFAEHGWVQGIDVDELLGSLPAATTVELLTRPGGFAVPGAPLARVWPDRSIGDRAAAERIAEAVRAAVRTGPARTLVDDPQYGVRQLADVALRALSPGTNDPTTAEDALFHLAVVLRAALLAAPPDAVRQHEDRVVVAEPAASPGPLIDLAFDEVRLAAIGQPRVLVAILDVLARLGASLPSGMTATRVALAHQADLTLRCSDLGDVPDEDRRLVRDAYVRLFAEHPLPAAR